MRLAIGYNADGRVQMARVVPDNQGRASLDVEHQWMQQDGKWSGWRRLGRGDGRTRPFISLQYARHPDGRLELFGMTDHLNAWRCHQTSPNGQWASGFARA